jgi:hypothetical protein
MGRSKAPYTRLFMFHISLEVKGTFNIIINTHSNSDSLLEEREKYNTGLLLYSRMNYASFYTALSWMLHYNFTAFSIIYSLGETCAVDIPNLRQAAWNRNITVENTYIVPNIGSNPRNPQHPSWQAIAQSTSNIFWVCLPSTNDVPNTIYYLTDIGVLAKNKIILGLPMISSNSFQTIRNYTLSHALNLTNLPIFFYGSDNKGVYVTKNYSKNPHFTYFEKVKSRYNLTSVNLRENVFYCMIYDLLFISLSGLSNAVNKHGVDVLSIVNRSWTDPKSIMSGIQYTNVKNDFSAFRGAYFSQPHETTNFFYEGIQFSNDGVFRAKISFYQVNIDAVVNGLSTASQMQALMDMESVMVFKNATWNENGSIVPPRLYPITCTDFKKK